MKINNKKKERHFIPMGFGVLTVSDSRTLTNDKSGDILENRILNSGHNIVERDLVKDNKVTIKKILKKWILTKNLDVIISIETIGTSAIQSRACAGVSSGTFLFALPGSPSACKDAWDKILCKQFDYRNLPCNFVEILPRLEEHKKRK